MPDTLTSHQPVAVAWDPAHATLTVAGELDCGTGPHLLAAALEVAERRPPLVELDLARVSFVDSAGWRAVGAALDACAEAGALVTISRRSPCVERFERIVDSAAATPSIERRWAPRCVPPALGRVARRPSR